MSVRLHFAARGIALLVACAAPLSTSAEVVKSTPFPVPDDVVVPYKCDNSDWSINGSDATLCGQLVTRDAGQVVTFGDGIVAFRKGELAGIKNLLRTEAPGDFGKEGFWVETGSIGAPGTLWWGRGRDGQPWLVGGGSWGIMYNHIQRIMVERRNVKLMLDAAGGRYAPFKTESVTYSQAGALKAVITGGLGGTAEPLLPAQITDATATLSMSPYLHGQIKFRITIEGRLREFTIPLKRNAKEATDSSTVNGDMLWTLKAGMPVPGSSQVGDCPLSKLAHFDCEYNEYDTRRHAREYYKATGNLYGLNSQYLAVRFDLTIDVAERNRTGALVKGLVILKQAM